MAKKARTVRVAIIGLGMGRSHLQGYRAHRHCEVVAICDVNEKRLSAVGTEQNIDPVRQYPNHKRLLRDARKLELDAVSVVLPNYLHAAVTRDCFQAGLHVLCDKPMAMNAVQARSMIQAAKKARRKLMINFSFRFRDQSQALKRLVDSGAIGEVYFGRTLWHRRRGLPGFGGWFGQKNMSGGGPVIDLGVHRLDLAMWLMGNPRPVTVSGSVFNVIGARVAAQQKKAFDVEDLGCALIRFDNGATLILEASWAGFSEKAEDMVTQLYGTKGGIIQRNLDEGYHFEARAYSEQHGTLWESRLQQSLEPVRSAYEQFIDAIREDREPPATGLHGLNVQLILDAIYRSARTGREVRIAKA